MRASRERVILIRHMSFNIYKKIREIRSTIENNESLPCTMGEIRMSLLERSSSTFYGKMITRSTRHLLNAATPKRCNDTFRRHSSQTCPRMTQKPRSIIQVRETGCRYLYYRFTNVRLIKLNEQQNNLTTFPSASRAFPQGESLQFPRNNSHGH